MFNPSIVHLQSTNDGTTYNSDVELALISAPANGRSLRRNADRTRELSIAQNESNENPGFVTRRSNVRNSHRKVDSVTGKPVIGYVQLLSSIPSDQFTEEEVRTLIAELVQFFVTSGESALATGIAPVVSNYSAVPRLMAGES